MSVLNPLPGPQAGSRDPQTGVVQFFREWYSWLNQVFRICFAQQQSGTTALRPTTGLWIGRRYYDTTLSKPIWVSQVTPTVVWSEAGTFFEGFTTTTNTGLGDNAGDSISTGARNTLVGVDAGTAITTADDCTGIGDTALTLCTGAQNTALGSTAGNTITSGTGNTCLGYNSDVDSATAANRTVVGAGAVGTVDNTVHLAAQDHNVAVGGATALATTATAGFLYVPTCAGAPTGTPTTITSRAPIVIDTTNNKLYFYSSGAWRDAGP